jgi:hypothetical protein
MYFPPSRLFVAGNPKAAGTSLRWWLLQTHGVDVAALTAASLWGESAPHQTVWDGAVDLRYTWDRLTPDEQEQALGSPEVLTVQPVRHPVTRTFSAWAGKYLTLEPYYAERLPEGFPQPPDVVGSTDHVTELFSAFVQSLVAHVTTHPDWEGIDVHFWPQHRLLARVPAGPTLLLRQEAVADGLRVVEEWLRTNGLEPVPMERANENVVPYQPMFVAAEALRALCRLYTEDFAAWDYPNEAPVAREQQVDLDWLNDVRGRNRRYGVVHRAAVDGRRRVAELEAELAAARQRERDLLASHSWRVTRPLRWASERLGRG